MKIDYKFNVKADLKSLKAGMVFSQEDYEILWIVTTASNAVNLRTGEVVSLTSTYFNNPTVNLHPDATVVNS